MKDRDELLKNFVDAALELMKEALAGLPLERAMLVNVAQKKGFDVCLAFSPGAGTVVVALHQEGGDAEPVTLCQIQIPRDEGNSH